MLHLERSVPTLLSLVKVAEMGSINRAATFLNVSQSALTRNIHRFELEIGVKLLSRTTLGVTLTPIGAALVEHARTVEAELLATRKKLEIMTGRSRDVLSVGTTSIALSPAIARGIEAMRREQPKVGIRLMQGTRAELLPALRRGEIDVMVAAFQPDTENLRLKVERLRSERYVLCVRKSHPLALRRDLGLRDLAVSQWILPRQGCELYQQIAAQFADERVPMPLSSIEMDSAQVVPDLIRSSDLIAIVPTSWLAEFDDLVALSGKWRLEPLVIAAYFVERVGRTAQSKRFAQVLSLQSGELTRRLAANGSRARSWTIDPERVEAALA